LLKKNNIIPLGFVIKIKNRDVIRCEFYKYNIFPPIHWILTDEFINKLFEKSYTLSTLTITIPITCLTDKKYTYLKNTLNKIINNENISKGV
jgi:hypothetical protein